MTRRLFSHKHWLHCNRENEDPDRARRIQLLREQERRLAEQVERERVIVERMRWEKLALEKAIRDKGPSINDVTQIFHLFGPPPPLSSRIHATYQ